MRTAACWGAPNSSSAATARAVPQDQVKSLLPGTCARLTGAEGTTRGAIGNVHAQSDYRTAETGITGRFDTGGIKQRRRGLQWRMYGQAVQTLALPGDVTPIQPAQRDTDGMPESRAHRLRWAHARGRTQGRRPREPCRRPMGRLDETACRWPPAPTGLSALCVLFFAGK